MCFKNLPVEFDAAGKPYLKGGIANPYGYERKELGEGQIKELLARNGHIREVNFDPVTRIAGALAFHSVTDLQERKVIETNAMATLFRGYEVILKGRDPRDAIFISSRACGVCGGVHSTCSAHALEMAFGVTPPPLGIIVRNLLLAAEFLYDHPLHLFLLAGPDYSQSAVEETNPGLWERAQRTPTEHGAVHGYATIGAIMTDLNPLAGRLYLEALGMTRVAREAYVILGGKYPHPETIIPGGLSTTISLTTFNEYYSRLVKLFDYAKKVALLWDDVFDFFLRANPAYAKVGARRKNLIDTGLWDDPARYDATYANCDDWGEGRWATPGVIVDGELRTTKLQAINIGLEEFVEHSFYEGWEGGRFPTDPSGGPLSPHHPWNKETKPKPQGLNWKEKYTWDTAPRWDRLAMETGPYSRMWNTAVARLMPHGDFIEATGHSLKLRLPKATTPELELEWHVPQDWNALERNRARAYACAYSALVAMENWLRGLKLLREGQTAVSTPYELPRRGTQIGVGFWGAGRGYLTHHAVIENGKIANYQIITPSTWMASPRDPFGQPGPYEEAVLNTPLLEDFDRPDDFKGIDILRAIRSFDPCMPCTTHVYAGDRTIVREVNTCACGVE
ncbi:MAG: nickel-dependent hydrogenase large subunit [Chloroflexota bacterium]|nr:nickel-dependent hydrogenase large subunit [Chloroflexota bacterium]